MRGCVLRAVPSKVLVLVLLLLLVHKEVSPTARSIGGGGRREGGGTVLHLEDGVLVLLLGQWLALLIFAKAGRRNGTVCV